MDKSDKRRAKHPSAQACSPIGRYRNAGDNEIDNCRKCRQANDLSMTHERSERFDQSFLGYDAKNAFERMSSASCLRRQSNPPTDSTAGYCCTTDPYRPRKHHGMSSASRTKYLVPQLPDEPYRADNKGLQTLRSLHHHLLAKNVAIVRKSRYKDDLDEEDEAKYADDPELPGDDNADEENREDVADENCEEGFEFEGKDYDDEDEGDYEVDEESDALEQQVDRLRIQRKTRTEPPLRGRQRVAAIEPSQHHRGHKNLPAIQPPARYCRVSAERDTPELPTEDDDEEPEAEPTPPRKSAWRSPTTHQERDTWNQSRYLMERYADIDRTSYGPAVQNRRPRTTRPEVETTTRSAQLETVRNRKCNRCAATSAPKTASSRNAACRLQDARYFVRESNGDEGECLDDPEPPMIYRSKQRKSKEYRSPIYDPREDTRNLDAEIGAIYKSSRSKNPRESPSVCRERTKHSVRAINRHDQSSAGSKHENRYWPQ